MNGPHEQLLALVPAPNLDGDNDNFFNSGNQPLNRNNIDAKVNWNRNERHQMWFKYSVMDALVKGDFSLGQAGGNACAAAALAPVTRWCRSAAWVTPTLSRRIS